jgi:hypothetical protein
MLLEVLIITKYFVMKTISKSISKAGLLLLSFLTSLASFAQEKKADIDVDINTKGDNWYAQPWVWVIGAAVFILLLVALLRGGRARE